MVIAEVFDQSAARFCLAQDVRVFKLNVADIANRPLVELFADEADAVFLSVGGSFVEEIHRVLGQLSRGAARVVLSYGFQNYPTLPVHSHLAKIRLLGLHFGLPVCFADHVSGDDELAMDLPCLAVAAGATSVEKHVIQVRDTACHDDYSAITPEQFRRLVKRLRQLEMCIGEESLDLDRAELQYREEHKKCPVLRLDLPAGHKLKHEDIDFKRGPGPKDFASPEHVIGRTLVTAVAAQTPLRLEHLR